MAASEAPALRSLIERSLWVKQRAPSRPSRIGNRYAAPPIRENSSEEKTAPAAALVGGGLGDVLPSHQRRVALAPARTEVAALGQRCGCTEHARRVHCKHLALLARSQGVGTQHHQRIDALLAQSAEPVREDAVDPDTVKVDR